MAKLKDKCKNMFEEGHLAKEYNWLLPVGFTMMGIIVGLIVAPVTHGIHIGIGNNAGNVTEK